jgi:hypothetical protein
MVEVRAHRPIGKWVGGLAYSITLDAELIASTASCQSLNGSLWRIEDCFCGSRIEGGGGQKMGFAGGRIPVRKLCRILKVWLFAPWSGKVKNVWHGRGLAVAT